MKDPHPILRQEIEKHLTDVRHLCKKWGVPALGTKLTLILRDPANDEMSLVYTDEEDCSESFRVARKLVQEAEEQ